MRKKLLPFLTFLVLLCGMNAMAQSKSYDKDNAPASMKNAVTLPQELGMVSSLKNTDVIIPVRIQNSGTNAIESLGFKVMLNGVPTEYTLMSGTEKTSSGGEHTVNIKVAAPAVSGVYDVIVTADKVNGTDNAAVQKVSEGSLVTLTRDVPHKVMFEEFTGLGCGWCPRGLVALEKARRTYGTDIVLISAHFNDAMSCREYNLIKEDQLPAGRLDRGASIDPYFGTNNKELFGINEDIKKCAAVKPVAEINVSAEINGDILTATSDVKFLYTGTGDFAVGYVLTEDGVKGEKWSQQNNYSQIRGHGFLEENDPDFELWLNGDSRLKGYVYNDVAIVAEGIVKGVDGSVPASFTEEVSNTYEVEFNLAKLKKIQNRKNLNVCVFLYDRSKGKVVNSNYMSFEHETGIEGVEADDDNVSEVARYTTDGRRINTPQRGINIVRYSDGSTKKVIVR